MKEEDKTKETGYRCQKMGIRRDGPSSRRRAIFSSRSASLRSQVDSVTSAAISLLLCLVISVRSFSFSSREVIRVVDC